MTDSSTSISQDFAAAVDEVIRERKTAKILGDRANCGELADTVQLSLHTMLQEMISVAGWAPFHKLADEKTHRQGHMQSIVPWRFYTLEKPSCCHLLRYLQTQAEQAPGSRWANAWESKIPRLLAGCSALVMVTWLPDPSDSDGVPRLTENNIEHIAAASAAVQNLLLAAQARGLHNYWSSGGILKDADVFDYVGIPQNQSLLGAIFLAHPDTDYNENQPGGLRDKRGDVTSWSTWVTLDK